MLVRSCRLAAQGIPRVGVCRHLALILAPDDNARTAYLVTARDMTGAERAAWRRAGKG